MFNELLTKVQILNIRIYGYCIFLDGENSQVLHLLRVQTRMPIIDASHQAHPLIKTKLRRPFICDICRQSGSLICYRCKLCNFSIHESCSQVTGEDNPRLHEEAHVEIYNSHKWEQGNTSNVEMGVPQQFQGGTNVELAASEGVGIQGTEAVAVPTKKTRISKTAAANQFATISHKLLGATTAVIRGAGQKAGSRKSSILQKLKLGSTVTGGPGTIHGKDNKEKLTEEEYDEEEEEEEYEEEEEEEEECEDDDDSEEEEEEEDDDDNE